MKYISMRTLIDYGKNLRFQSADQMAKVYEQMPGIELCRCEACVYSAEFEGINRTWCARHTGMWFETEKDGFCSQGKRRG